MFGMQMLLDTNLLVLATRNACIGGHAQHEAPTLIGSRSGGIKAIQLYSNLTPLTDGAREF